MAQVIEQFMWQWQPHFRISCEVLAETALAKIGARLDPQVFVVGLARKDGADHPICIEPETGPLRPEHLSRLSERASALFAAHPESEIWHSDRRVGEARTSRLRHEMMGMAVAGAIEESGVLPGRRLFVSAGGFVAGFDVHVAIAVDKDRYDALPKLEGEDVDRFPAASSFTRGLIDLILREADAGLRVPEPSSSDIRRSKEDLIREAGDRFFTGCLYRTRNFDLGTAFNALNGATARSYEGSAASGRILLVHPDDEGLSIQARFIERVGLTRTRAIRKLLQTTNESCGLLVHDGGAFGLGDIDAARVSGDVYEVIVTSHATWDLRHGSDTMLRVSYGEASLPRPMFDERVAEDALDRILGAGADCEALMSLVGAATHATHGTTLVISADAAGEAVRLSGPATQIVPAKLSPDLLLRYADMDGAILVDPTGACHAVGVILDGKAHGRGDSARGARYNSALRYAASTLAATLIAVVSEDGGVDLVPEPRVRMRRQAIEDAVTRFEMAISSDDPREFSSAFDAARALRFYLTGEQCARVNAINLEEQAGRKLTGNVVILREELSPDPEMSESYFLDQEGGPEVADG